MRDHRHGSQLRISAPLLLREGGHTRLRSHLPKARGIVVRNDVCRVHHRRARERLQKNAPEVGVAVQHIEAVRLPHRAAEVHPLAKMPVVQRALRAVGSRKRRHQFALHLGPGSSKHRHFVPQPNQFARQQADQRLDAAAGFTSDRRGKRGNLGDSHVSLPQPRAAPEGRGQWRKYFRQSDAPPAAVEGNPC